jgi:heat shock protein HslJ
MRSVLILSFSAFALAAGAHSSAAQPPPHEPLAGTAWQLVKFQGGDGAVKAPDDRSKYTIAFTADGRVSVRFDCNRGNGRYKGTPPEVLFGPLALTRATCPAGSMHDQLVKQWPSVRSYVIKDKHLFLSLAADGGIYEFEPFYPLEGTHWHAIELAGNAISASEVKPGAYLEFQTGGKVTGLDGCNRVTGIYKLSGDEVTFGPMAGTEKACLNTETIERGFRHAIHDAKKLKITGDRLELFDASGVKLAVFEARAAG